MRRYIQTCSGTGHEAGDEGVYVQGIREFIDG